MSELKCVNLILIETSTSLCSVALSKGDEIIAYRESSKPKAHASLTTPFVKEVLDEAGIGVKDCAGVCVSSGPGSYTGLRVGSSTAKGLCFGAGIPLFALSTMDILEQMGSDSGHFDYIVPMIDARRMEVYTATFAEGRQIEQTSPRIIESGSYTDLLDQGSVLFIGDGARKCEDVISHPNAHFMECNPTAKAMAQKALRLYELGQKEDVAYFEPFYLKDFIATTSKKSLF